MGDTEEKPALRAQTLAWVLSRTTMGRACAGCFPRMLARGASFWASRSLLYLHLGLTITGHTGAPDTLGKHPVATAAPTQAALFPRPNCPLQLSCVCLSQERC